MANDNTMVIDFTGVESSSFIGEGVHLVRIKDAAYTKASTGSSQLEINFENADGATRKAWYNLLPQALWKLKGLLEVLGIPCDGKINLSTRVLIGKTCYITVEPDPNDSKKAIITDVRSATQPAVAEAPYAAPVAQPIPVQPAPAAQEPVSIPAQPTTPPNTNLPPWMNSAPSGNAPQGNLPPWMAKK